MPSDEILLKGEAAVQFDPDTGEVMGSLPLVKVASKNEPNDLREGALFYDEGICGWVFNVKKAGLYNITFSYFAYDELVYELDGEQHSISSKSSAVQRKVYIDYKVPFYEARQVNFERVWKDSGLLRVDEQTNNEKRPYQEEAPQWQTLAVRDYMGYEQEPFKFYFEEGTHVLSFESVKEGMVVEYAMIHQISEVPTYAELTAQYQAAGYQKVTGVNSLYIQAEGLHAPEVYTSKHSAQFLTQTMIDKYSNYIDPVDTTAYDATTDVTYDILKSSPTIYAITDRSSPLTVPGTIANSQSPCISGAKTASVEYIL